VVSVSTAQAAIESAAVDAAYAQDAVHAGKKTYATDAERVAYLFAPYQRLTSLLPTDKPKKKRR
jgi:hypothetical protein